ncbi:ADP-ribosylglycohydrolase family protein, partial [Bacillus pumilus]
PTIMYGAMFAKAFFCNAIRKLIDEGLKYLPVNGRFARGVRKMIALHKQYPNSWQTARAKMAEEFYINEDPMT